MRERRGVTEAGPGVTYRVTNEIGLNYLIFERCYVVTFARTLDDHCPGRRTRQGRSYRCPHVALVIADADKAREAQAMTYQRGGFRREAAAVRQRPARPVGSLRTAMATECPEGRPNCRNCGDPAHAATCAKDGHCPHCGTRHGVAPDSVLAKSGLEMQEIRRPSRDEVWDAATRGWVKRPPVEATP